MLNITTVKWWLYSDLLNIKLWSYDCTLTCWTLSCEVMTVLWHAEHYSREVTTTVICWTFRYEMMTVLDMLNITAVKWWLLWSAEHSGMKWWLLWHAERYNFIDKMWSCFFAGTFEDVQTGDIYRGTAVQVSVIPSWDRQMFRKAGENEKRRTGAVDNYSGLVTCNTWWSKGKGR